MPKTSELPATAQPVQPESGQPERRSHQPEGRSEPVTGRIPALTTLSIGLDLSSAGAGPAQGGAGRARGQGSWTPPFDEGRLTDLVRTAERGTLDFVAFGPSFHLDGDGNRPRNGALDAAVVTSRLAKQTTRIGLVPTVSAASLDPANIAAAVTAVDTVSEGRTAWQAAGTDLPEAIDSVRATWRANRNPDDDGRREREAE